MESCPWQHNQFGLDVERLTAVTLSVRSFADRTNHVLEIAKSKTQMASAYTLGHALTTRGPLHWSGRSKHVPHV